MPQASALDAADRGLADLSLEELANLPVTSVSKKSEPLADAAASVYVISNEDIRRNRLVGRLDIGFITAHRRFLMGMQRKAMELVAAMAKAQQEVDTARMALAEAAKQRKILEKLRETQEGRWREELSRKEMITADEIAMQLSNDPTRRMSA